MKIVKTRVGVALLMVLGMTISGCGKGIGYTRDADDLGVSMAAHLRAQPPVLDVHISTLTASTTPLHCGLP
jgi:hypothetical protein